MTSTLALALAPPPATAWRAVTAAQRHAVVRRMEGVLLSLGGPLVPAARRLLRADSKMLRPGLTLAVAATSGDLEHRALSGAAAVELLHCATLVHDDLIDGADSRRGVPTVFAQEGPASAVVTGDFLIAAAQTASLDVGPAALEATVTALAQLCIGQAKEEEHRYDMTTTAADALAVARAKTGSLLRTACVIGAEAGGLPHASRAALAEYGTDFGMALQVVDDVLDLASSRSLLGKPTGSDLRTGVMGVPAALALDREPALASLIIPGAGCDELARAARLIVRCGALVDAVEVARALAARATDAFGGADVADAVGLAEWPQRYVESLLETRVAPEFRSLLGVRR